MVSVDDPICTSARTWFVAIDEAQLIGTSPLPVKSRGPDATPAPGLGGRVGNGGSGGRLAVGMANGVGRWLATGLPECGPRSPQAVATRASAAIEIFRVGRVLMHG